MRVENNELSISNQWLTYMCDNDIKYIVYRKYYEASWYCWCLFDIDISNV